MLVSAKKVNRIYGIMRSFLLLKIISQFGGLRKGIGIAGTKNFLTLLRCKCSWQLYLADRYEYEVKLFK